MVFYSGEQCDNQGDRSMTTKLVIAVIAAWTAAGALWTALATSSASGFAEILVEFTAQLFQ